MKSGVLLEPGVVDKNVDSAQLLDSLGKHGLDLILAVVGHARHYVTPARPPTGGPNWAYRAEHPPSAASGF